MRGALGFLVACAIGLAAGAVVLVTAVVVDEAPRPPTVAAAPSPTTACSQQKRGHRMNRHVTYTCPSCGHQSSAVTARALSAAAQDHIQFHADKAMSIRTLTMMNGPTPPAGKSWFER